MTTQHDERAAFEKEYRLMFPVSSADPKKFEQNGIGGYEDFQVNNAWRFWQARALLAADAQAGGELVAWRCSAPPCKCDQSNYSRCAFANFNHPQPQAVARGWKDRDTAKLVNDLRDVAVQFHAAEQLRERIAHIIRPLADLLSASPAAPEGANPEREIEQLIRERDQRDEIIDRLCDAVLGSERPEWSSAYGFDDAVADVEERIAQLHQPSVDKAWKRFETANAAQPQATEGKRPFAWLCPSVAPHYHAPLTHWGEKPPEPLSAEEALSLGWFPVFKGFSAQPQAQGEPEAVAWIDLRDLEALQTYSSQCQVVLYRAAGKNRVALYKQINRESLAQHRAALEECVEALKLAMHWAGPAMERDMRSPSNSQWMVEKTQAQEDSIYAAITHANQVLDRKEGE